MVFKLWFFSQIIDVRPRMQFSLLLQKPNVDIGVSLLFFFVVTVQCFNVYYCDLRFLNSVCELNSGHLQGPKCAVNNPEMWQTQYDSE